MLNLSTSTKIKGPIRPKVGNALENLKSLNKSEFGPREGAKLITPTPVTHDQSSCKSTVIIFPHMTPLV